MPLLRTRDDRMIGGVCGGIARSLGWDPTLVRVVYVLLTIFTFGAGGILAYIILWILMPED